MTNNDLNIYFNYLRDVLYYPHRARIDEDALSDEDHREFAEAVLAFGKMVIETREFARNLSRGDLDVQLPPLDNELAAPLKALHSTLKHLTWQARQVANGDYEQNVRFMGEFSIAFNEMVAQLAERQQQVEAATERDHARLEELGRVNSIFEVITANMEEWIVMVDRKTGERLFANHQADSVLINGVPEQQLYDILFEYATFMSKNDDPRKEEFTLVSDVALQYFEMMLYPIKWLEHDAVVCVMTDVTTAKEEFNRMEDAAHKDALTGAYNRFYGMKTLHRWVDEHASFQLIFIDIDLLKYVNDVFGHAEGDVYIRYVSELLLEISAASIVCRIGGDEFMVLIQENDADGRDMVQVLEGLRNKLIDSSTRDSDNKITYHRSVSYGVVDVDKENRLDTSELLAMADERMYEYKKTHKKGHR